MIPAPGWVLVSFDNQGLFDIVFANARYSPAMKSPRGSITPRHERPSKVIAEVADAELVSRPDRSRSAYERNADSSMGDQLSLRFAERTSRSNLTYLNSVGCKTMLFSLGRKMRII